MQLMLILLLLSSVFCLANEGNAKEGIEALMTLRQAIQTRQGQDSQDFAESLQVKGPTSTPTPVLTHKPTGLPTTPPQNIAESPTTPWTSLVPSS